MARSEQVCFFLAESGSGRTMELGRSRSIDHAAAAAPAASYGVIANARHRKISAIVQLAPSAMSAFRSLSGAKETWKDDACDANAAHMSALTQAASDRFSAATTRNRL